MEKFKLVKTSEKPLTWLEIKEVLNSKSDEELSNDAIIWDVDDVHGEINGAYIQEIYEAEEDQINPSGEGVEPISNYDPEEVKDEVVYFKKGSLLMLTSR